MPSSRLNIHNKLFLTTLITSIALANFWVYQLFQMNTLVGTLLIIESILLFLTQFLRLKIIINLIFITLLFLGILLTINYFDKTVFSTTEIETIQKLKNHEYYANELGKIYRNKVGLFYFGELKPRLNKLNHKLFSFLDIRIYFRLENSGPAIYYPIFLFPFFVTGFIYLLIYPKIHLLIYTALALMFSVITHLDNNLGPVLLFPLFNIIIGLGFMQAVKIIKPLFSSHE